MGFYVNDGLVAYDSSTTEIRVFKDKVLNKKWQAEYDSANSVVKLTEVPIGTTSNNPNMVDGVTGISYVLAANSGNVYLLKVTVYPDVVEKILGSFYYMQLGAFYKIFATTNIADPVLELKTSSGVVIENYTGVEFDESIKLWVFDVYIDSLGEISSTSVTWQDGFYIFKLTNSLEEGYIVKPVQIFREEDWFATVADLQNTDAAINNDARITI
jgi:hypothetical protein